MPRQARLEASGKLHNAIKDRENKEVVAVNNLPYSSFSVLYFFLLPYLSGMAEVTREMKLSMSHAACSCFDTSA